MPGKEANRTSHPSYGSINIGRVQGRAQLFQSPFYHDGFVKLTISGAELERSLSADWIYDRAPKIEVYLSYNQFAEALTSLNSGSTPCTIASFNGDQIESPPVEDKFVLFKREADENLQSCRDSLKRLEDKINESTISVKSKKEFLNELTVAERALSDKLPFVANQFAEYTEVMVRKAKTEIRAYADHTIHEMGINALRQNIQSPPVDLKPAIDVSLLPGGE